MFSSPSLDTQSFSPPPYKRQRSADDWPGPAAATASAPRPAARPLKAEPALCWYISISKRCDASTCRYSHGSYRQSCQMLDAGTRPARQPWDDPSAWQQRPSFRPLLYALPALGADVWVAVMPVPVSMLCIALRSPDFTAVLATCASLQPDDVWLLQPSDAEMPSVGGRLWGSVVMRGTKAQVERGREAVIWLMDSGSHMQSGSKALPEMQWHMRRWNEAELPAKNQRTTQQEAAAAASTVTTPCSNSSSPSASSPRLAASAPASAFVSAGSALLPCPWHMLRSVGGRCTESLCALSHASYPQLFLAFCQHAPQRLRDLPSTTSDFAAVLCLSAPHMTTDTPLLVASFPLPRLPSVVRRLLGEQQAHLLTLQECSRVQQCKTRLRFEDYAVLHRTTEEVGDWLSCRVLGSVQAVDVFMQGVFFLLSPGRVSAASLAEHLHDFEKQRAAAGTRATQLFSLSSRGLQLPAGALEPPPLSSGAAAAASPSSSSPLSDTISSPVAAAASLLPAFLDQTPGGADWADCLLSDMAERGLAFTSQAEVPEFAHNAHPGLRRTTEAVFACLPLPARQSVRDVFCYEDLQHTPSIAVIEDRHAVTVDVPRLTDDEGQTRNAERCAWLHVVVSQSSKSAAAAANSVRPEWDAALRFVLARYRAACEAAHYL